MTDGLTQGGNETVSGEVSSESLVGQAASAVEITAPANGETKNISLTQGQTATLNFDAAAATPSLESGNFVLSFDSDGDGSADSRIVFENLVQAAQGDEAPVLVIGGVEFSAGLLIGQAQALASGETLETAAGAGTGPQGGGGSTYNDDFGDVIDGLSSQNGLEGTLAGLVAGLEGQATVFDDAPTALPNDPALADDGELSEGNLGGVGDEEGVNLTGTLGHDYGDDGAGSLLLTGAQLPDGFTSTVSADGLTLTISQDGVDVLQVTLGDATNGNYEVELLAAIQHPEGDDENNVDFTIEYRVTDSDGDFADGTLNLSVDDDTPVATDAVIDGGTVNEDALPGGNDDKGQSLTTDGSVAGLFSLGADGLGSYGFVNQITQETVTIEGSNQDGSVRYVRFTLTEPTAVTIATDGPTIDPQIHLFNDDGSLDENDWLASDDDDGSSAGSHENSVIDSGDEIGVLPAGTYIVAVSDYELTEEEAIAGINDTSDIGARTGDVTVIVASQAPISGLPELTSGGEPVVYSTEGNVLTATADGNTIFTLEINPATGAYTFTLVGQVDHLPNDPANDDGQVLELDFGALFVATDSDGDRVDATGSLIIKIEDDVPVAVDDVYAGDAVVEDGNLTAVGNVLTNDEVGADGAVVTSTSKMDGEYGSIVINADGSYTYTLNNNSEKVQKLAEGESHTETFTYEITDGDGDTDTATVEIVVTGSNDAPVIGGLAGSYYGASSIGNLSKFLNIVANNPADATFDAAGISYDIGRGNLGNGDNLQKFLGDDADTLSNDPAHTRAGGLKMVGQVYLEAGTYQFQVRADDGFQIKIDGNTAIQYARNQAPTTRNGASFEITESGYYEVDISWWDQGGAYVFEPKLSFEGGAFKDFTPENFEFQQDVDATVVEAGGNDAGIPSVSGRMIANDIDNNDQLTWSSQTDGAYGSFSIDPVTGEWTYVIDNDKADHLAEGEEVVETFTVTVTDLAGATDTQEVSVTVKGTNDAPEAVADKVLTNVQGPVEIPDWALTNNDKDVDGDALTVSGVANPVQGTVTDNGDSVTFTPVEDIDFLGFERPGGDGVAQERVFIGDGYEAEYGHVWGGESNNQHDQSGFNQATNLERGDWVRDTDPAFDGMVVHKIEFSGQIDDARGRLPIFGPRQSLYDTDAFRVELMAGETLSLASFGGASSLLSLSLSGPGANGIDFDALSPFTSVAGGVYYLNVATTVKDLSGRTDENNHAYDIELNIDSTALIPDTQFDYTVSDGSLTDGATVTIEVQNSDTVIGTEDDEILIGSNNADILVGDFAETSDHLNGLTATGGDDSLAGNDGNDFLIGDFAVLRNGKDLENSNLTGGNDRIVGGEGNDTIVGDVYVEDDIGDDSSSATDTVSITGGDDYLDGGAGDDEIIGDVRNDDDVEESGGHTLIGGDDTLLGGTGEDELIGDFKIRDDVEVGPQVLTGGDDRLEGGADNDVIVGDIKISDDIEAGNNKLTGGDDIIIGGSGDDVLTGDFIVADNIDPSAELVGGADTFIFGSDTIGDNDTITDFNAAEGDKLDLSELLTGFAAGADNDATASILEDYLSIAKDGADTVITIDADGAGVGTAGSTIRLENVDLTGAGSIDDHGAIKSLLDGENLIVD